MEAGEQYLDIKVVGHAFIRAFPNTKKDKPDQPDFKADGVAVWVRSVKKKEDGEIPYQSVDFK